MKANLQITAAHNGQRTYLQQVQFTAPFKVMDITEDKAGHWLHLMLMSASPGILDGDVYDMEIAVAQNSALHLHTQAYQRIFHMQQGATQQLQVRLQIGASFCYLPHPSVPHDASIFTNRNQFYLSDHCRLVYGEVLTCGRKLNGEQFLLNKYHSLTQIFLNNQLVLQENLLVQPALLPVQAMGQMEGYTHQASMVWLQPDADIESLQAQILSLLGAENNISFGVSRTPISGLIIRLLGQGAEQLYDCLQRIHQLLPLLNPSTIAHAP
jgi:urease accessory protein